MPASLNQVAVLFRTMGDLFDAKYYRRSVESFEFLAREYPTGKYREDAPLAAAQIQMEDLHDSDLARKSYEDFLAYHPRSSHAAEVRAILEKLAAENPPEQPAAPSPAAKNRPERAERPEKTNPKEASEDKALPAQDSKPEMAEESSGAANTGSEVSRIRTWNADTYTRIVIDVGSQVKYQAARISRPDRIYFDIDGVKLSRALLHTPINVDSGGFLKTVRVAQNQTGVVRIVLEVNRVTDYSVFLLPDPYRLVVDVYGTSAAAEAAARNTAPPSGPLTTDLLPPKPEKPGKETKEASSKPALKAAEKAAAKVAPSPAASAPVVEAQAQAAPPPAMSANTPSGSTEQAPAKTTSNREKNSQKNAASASSKSNAASDTKPGEPTLSAAVAPSDADASALFTRPASPKKSSRPKKSAHDQAEEMGPPPTPELTRDGLHSLTRALGLKIGRIVIDAGHGGRDTGTIGPSGLMEKDLCLDVVLRLGKLIQQKLPSAEVVFTRDDDTFIPLERRTEIANQAKADLFISVHANSSQDHHARGIETYYLNFTGSSDAMEVASRENSLSDNGVHNLQDIVKKIANNEKIEESRDLAAMLQDSLSKRMESSNRGDRNRGVRKAPFVVLIGANMPSVLAEISFLSNPSDEQWLKKPENRQRVADGLYHGIESYLQSTNSLTSNQIHPSVETFTGKVARSGNSQ